MPEPTLPTQVTEPQVETAPVRKRNGIVELFQERTSKPYLSTEEIMDPDGPLSEKIRESAELIYRYGDHAIAWADCHAVKSAYQVIADIGNSHYELFRRDDPEDYRIDTPVDEIEIISEGYLVDRSITDPQESFQARWMQLKESLRRNVDLPDPSERTPKIGKYDIMDEGLIPASDREQTYLVLAKVEVAKNLITRRLAEKTYDIPEKNVHIKSADEDEKQRLYKQLETMFLYSQLLKGINALRDKWEPEVFPTPQHGQEPKKEINLHPDANIGLPPLVINKEPVNKPENGWSQTLAEQLEVPRESKLPIKFLKTVYENGVWADKLVDITVNNKGRYQVPASFPEASIIKLRLKQRGNPQDLDERWIRLQQGAIDDQENPVAIAYLLNSEDVAYYREIKYEPAELISEIEL